MNNDTKTALKAALEFYADQDNYTPVHDGTHYPDGRVADDEGAKARDTLGLIEREGDEIKTLSALEAAFREIIDRATPHAAMLHEDFHNMLQTALIHADDDIREQAAAFKREVR